MFMQIFPDNFNFHEVNLAITAIIFQARNYFPVIPSEIWTRAKSTVNRRKTAVCLGISYFTKTNTEAYMKECGKH